MSQPVPFAIGLMGGPWGLQSPPQVPLSLPPPPLLLLPLLLLHLHQSLLEVLCRGRKNG